MKKTICRICSEGCGLVVKNTAAGLVVVGDSAHPISRGFICPKGKAALKAYVSPSRLTMPLKKTKGGWEKVSWAAALEIITENLLKIRQEHRAESIVFYKGEAAKFQEAADYLRHFAYAFGSPNFITVDSMCHASLAMAHELTCGTIPYFDAQRHQCALIWGASLQASHPRLFSDLIKAKKRGCKIIVVDPTKTPLARSADVHWQIRSGTDGYLALALAKLFMAQNSQWAGSGVSGCAEWAEKLHGIDVEALLEPTGLQRAHVTTGLEILMDNQPVWTHQGSALELQPHGFQSIRSIINFSMLLDHHLHNSGYAFPLRTLPGGSTYPPMPPPLGADRVPLFTHLTRSGHILAFPDAVLRAKPYAVRGLFVSGGNPAVTLPDSQLFAACLSKLDFLVVHDLFMTKTAKAADLVLPAASFLEFHELHDYGSFNQPLLGLIQPVLDESTGWPLWSVLFSLAERLGLKSFFPWQHNEEALRYRLGSTISLDSFRSGGEYGQVVDYSAYAQKAPRMRSFAPAGLTAYGIDRLPEKAHFDSEHFGHAYAAYPFTLTTGNRDLMRHNSQLWDENAPELLDLLICKEDLERTHYKENSRVSLCTPWGALLVRIKVGDTAPGLLCLPHGSPVHRVNELTSVAASTLDSVTGFPWLKAVPAKLERP